MYILTERGKKQKEYLEGKVFEDALMGEDPRYNKTLDWRRNFLASLWQVEETGEAYSPVHAYWDLETFLKREGYIEKDV